MHYYAFNIGDYTKRTARLSIIEDLAYRRLLDLYYLNERPFNETEQQLAREIGLQDYQAEVTYILDKYFPFDGSVRTNKRASEEIKLYHSKKKAASKAGKASGKARRSKAIERPLNDRSQSVEPTNNHKPITSNDEPINSNHKPVTNKHKTNGKSKDIVELKPDDAQCVFRYWQKTMNHPRAAYDDKRKALIKKQLRNYSRGDLELAITGCSVTPHNMGENDRGEVYDSIELILRDAAHIDRFMKNAIDPPKGKVVTMEQSSREAQEQADRIKKQLGWDQ